MTAPVWGLQRDGKATMEPDSEPERVDWPKVTVWVLVVTVSAALWGVAGAVAVKVIRG
jgi:hypothetical protein